MISQDIDVFIAIVVKTRLNIYDAILFMMARFGSHCLSTFDAFAVVSWIKGRYIKHMTSHSFPVEEDMETGSFELIIISTNA